MYSAKKLCAEVLENTSPGFRTEEQINIILDYLAQAKALPIVLDDRDVLTELCQGLKFLQIPQNQIVFLQGQPATSYYITFTGTVDIHEVLDHDAALSILQKYNGKLLAKLNSSFNRFELGSHVCRFQDNKSFGELALLTDGGKRTASAVTSSSAELIVVEPELYARTLKPYHADQAKFGHILQRVKELELCKGLSGRDITQIAKETRDVSIPFRSKICSAGSTIENVIYISEGEIRETSTRSDRTEASVNGKGFYIGAVDILQGNTKFTNTYHTVSNVKCLSISLEGFSFMIKNEDNAQHLLDLENARNHLHSTLKHKARHCKTPDKREQKEIWFESGKDMDEKPKKEIRAYRDAKGTQNDSVPGCFAATGEIGQGEHLPDQTNPLVDKHTSNVDQILAGIKIPPPLKNTTTDVLSMPCVRAHSGMLSPMVRQKHSAKDEPVFEFHSPKHQMSTNFLPNVQLQSSYLQSLSEPKRKSVNPCQQNISRESLQIMANSLQKSVSLDEYPRKMQGSPIQPRKSIFREKMPSLGREQKTISREKSFSHGRDQRLRLLSSESHKRSATSPLSKQEFSSSVPSQTETVNLCQKCPIQQRVQKASPKHKTPNSILKTCSFFDSKSYEQIANMEDNQSKDSNEQNKKITPTALQHILADFVSAEKLGDDGFNGDGSNDWEHGIPIHDHVFFSRAQEKSFQFCGLKPVNCEQEMQLQRFSEQETQNFRSQKTSTKTASDMDTKTLPEFRMASPFSPIDARTYKTRLVSSELKNLGQNESDFFHNSDFLPVNKMGNKSEGFELAAGSEGPQHLRKGSTMKLCQVANQHFNVGVVFNDTDLKVFKEKTGTRSRRWCEFSSSSVQAPPSSNHA